MKYEVSIASKGKVAASIRTEFAGIGRYTAWLYPPKDRGQPKVVFQGASDDDLPDEFALPDPKLLLGRLCVVEALVASATNANAKVGVRVGVSQSGEPIFSDGLFEQAEVQPNSAIRFLFFLRFKRAP